MNQTIKIGRILPQTCKIHQNQEVWCSGGVSPTLKASHSKDPPKVLVKKYERKQIENGGDTA